MNLDEIQLSWEEDSKIDEDNLHSESTKIPSLHAKYYRILNNILLMKKLEENKFKQLKKTKWQYYTGKADPEVYIEKPFDQERLLNFVKRAVENSNLKKQNKEYESKLFSSYELIGNSKNIVNIIDQIKKISITESNRYIPS